ncbi:hypothetical protein CHISP_2532 [Chitinispirillum alkaliphilum]|nr:hypothetical protein CHISP_2532 [Chitinispirillum alkaliphilum]
MSGNVLFILTENSHAASFYKMCEAKYKVKIVNNIDGALNLITKFIPDVIVYEMNYGQIENLKKLTRSRLQKFSIPVIVVAAENNLEFERYVRMENITYYFLYPVNVEEMDEALSSCIKQQGKRKYLWITEVKE